MKSTQAAPLDPIAALHMAIMQGQEDIWAHHAVPAPERERLRPGVRAVATAVANRMREDHAARNAQP